jgi:hypothetical protein
LVYCCDILTFSPSRKQLGGGGEHPKACERVRYRSGLNATSALAVKLRAHPGGELDTIEQGVRGSEDRTKRPINIFR